MRQETISLLLQTGLKMDGIFITTLTEKRS